MSVPYQDYYEILGVKKDAGHQEIQRAYRKLARQYHPDISKAKDAEEKFKKINEAYEVLGDDKKRQKYDAIGTQPPPGEGGFQGAYRGGYQGESPGGFEYRFTGDEGAEFSDFFRTYFGRAEGAGEREGGAPRKRRGRDLELEVEVTLADSLHGARKSVDVEITERGADGKPTLSRRSLEIPVPKGVVDGSVVRIPGAGGKGSSGGADGDLYVMFRLRPDRRFELKEHDILTTVDVAPWEAALGAKVQVPTIDGQVNMTLPSGTSSGHILRLRGKGLPRPDGTSGDELVNIRVMVPSTLTDTEKRLFTELARESRFKPRG